MPDGHKLAGVGADGRRSTMTSDRSRSAARSAAASPLPLSRPLHVQLSRNFTLNNQTRPLSFDENIGTTRTASARRRSEQRQRTGEWVADHPRVGAHPVDRALPNAGALAVEPAHGLVPHVVEKHRLPLMRGVQNRRIAPGQPAEGPAGDAKIAGGLDDVAEVLAKGARSLLVAEMLERGRTLRKHRH